MSDEQWDALAIPVNMAFLTTGSDGGMHCHYPSPAGATESLLTLEGWEELVEQNPILGQMEPDVEALLVNRAGETHEATDAQTQEHEYFLVPIDACFELVGLIRVHWRGFSGGKQAWDRIGDFFNGLRSRADIHGGRGVSADERRSRSSTSRCWTSASPVAWCRCSPSVCASASSPGSPSTR